MRCVRMSKIERFIDTLGMRVQTGNMSDHEP